MSHSATRCVVKSGPEAGATYYVRTRRDWGVIKYTLDAERTGWHKSAKEARASAEAAGWVYVTDRQGQRTMVHESARKYYK